MEILEQTDGDSTYDAPGPMEGTNVADDVDNIYPSGPGVSVGTDDT